MTHGQEELLELIQNASENTEGLVRTDAVRRLKRLALRQMDAIALAEFARKAEDPAWRTTAAQVLGYHRAASSFSALVDPPALSTLRPRTSVRSHQIGSTPWIG